MTESERRYPFFLPPTVLVVIAAVLAGAGYVGWTRLDHRPRAEAGQFVKASEVESGDWAKVPTPWGTVDVLLSEPEAELRDRVSSVKPSELRAPKGGSFVGIMAKLPDPSPPSMPRTASTSEEQVKQPSFSLVADGRRYQLEGKLGIVQEGDSKRLYESIGGYFAVPGKPKQIQVEVEYDGERGLFGVRGAETTEGRFNEVKVPPTTTTPDLEKCGQANVAVVTEKGKRPQVRSADREVIEENCLYSPPQRHVYVAGLGWAKPGQEWLAVSVVASAPKSVPWTARDGRQLSYRVYGPGAKPKFTFDGTSTAPVPTDQQESGQLFTSLAKGAGTSLAVAMRFKAERGPYLQDIQEPAELTVDAKWLIQLR